MSVVATAIQAARHAIAALEQAQPRAQLAARLYVAQLFFVSGLTKLRDWETTLALFADEYQVPLLPTNVAAVLGAAGELVLPVLLALDRFVAPRLLTTQTYTRAA